jgi:hypothetical protein
LFAVALTTHTRRITYFCIWNGVDETSISSTANPKGDPSRNDLLDRAQIVRSLYSVSKQNIPTKDRAAIEKDLRLISKIEPLKDPAVLPALHRSEAETIHRYLDPIETRIEAEIKD